MAWVWVGIAIAVVSLVVLAVLLLSLWKRTKTLMRAVAAAGESVATATEALGQVQAGRPALSPSRTDT